MRAGSMRTQRARGGRPFVQISILANSNIVYSPEKRGGHLSFSPVRHGSRRGSVRGPYSIIRTPHVVFPENPTPLLHWSITRNARRHLFLCSRPRARGPLRRHAYARSVTQQLCKESIHQNPETPPPLGRRTWHALTTSCSARVLCACVSALPWVYSRRHT